jgi:uroporphyrinogen III methyltransferase/synthase
MSKGKVYFVGAGPGDPRLITLRGKEAIHRADVIVYDRLASPRLLIHRKSNAQLVFVGKNPDKHQISQLEINELLVQFALQGKVVTRLKGGDPSVFGRVGEEAESLVNHHIPFEMIPGVSSAIAVPIYAGIPVTHRDFTSSICIITGHEYANKTYSSLDWEHLAKAGGTMIFLMGVANIEQIAQELIRHGKPKELPVALIRWGTTSAQETITSTLEHIAQLVIERNFQAPAVIIVGEVVKLRDKLAWFETKPLFSKKVIVTRATNQASELVESIDEAGGEAIQFPVISIHRVSDKHAKKRIEEAYLQVRSYDWLVFTSVNGVHYFFLEMRERQLDIRQLAQARIAAIGPKTYDAIKEHGLIPDVQAQHYQSEGLLETLAKHIQPGQSALLPTANLATDEFAKQLRMLGVHVTQVDIYENKCNVQDDERAVERLLQHDIDIVTFTSSSTIHYFMQALATHGIIDATTYLSELELACIGPKTANTLHEYGLEATYIAQEATVASLVQAMISRNTSCADRPIPDQSNPDQSTSNSL